MKVIEILNFNRELLKRLQAAGIRLEDPGISTCTRTIPAYSIKVKKSRMLWPYCPKSIR